MILSFPGKFVDYADSNRLLFSSTTRFSHKEAQAQIITAKRKAFLVPRRLSSLQSKEAHISDAGLSNGRRSRVGWAPKLHLFNAGGPLGNEIDGLKSATKEQAVLLGFDTNALRALPSSPFTVTVEKICIGDENDDHSYLVVSILNVLVSQCYWYLHKISSYNPTCLILFANGCTKEIDAICQICNIFFGEKGFIRNLRADFPIQRNDY